MVHDKWSLGEPHPAILVVTYIMEANPRILVHPSSILSQFLNNFDQSLVPH
jgi:hypothetical protein